MVSNKHYVATAYVYDAHTDQFLLVFHKKLEKWLPPGGHLDIGEEPHTGALRELAEETGLSGRILNLLGTPNVSTPDVAQLPSPFCVLSEHIPAVGAAEEHIHIDFVYAMEIDRDQALQVDKQEVLAARWFSWREIDRLETYANVRRVCQAISYFSRK